MYNFHKTKGHFTSASGADEIAFYVYRPTAVYGGKNPTGILQISHGMCEFIERYEEFAEFLCEHGFVVCGNDHLGHKGSVKTRKGLGYFAEKDGDKFLTDDVKTLTDIMQKKYPNVPYFLFGHSMGSFVARDYLTKYGTRLSGAIICGTSGGNPATTAGIALIDAFATINGEGYRSKIINSIAFKDYNIKFMPTRTNFDWLTKDEEIVDKYLANPYNNFIFTLSGFRDLFSLLNRVSEDNWAYSVPKALPIFLISGDKDPVGAYGRGVKKVYKRLIEAGATAELKLYRDDRHELLNEVDRAIIFQDILAWVERNLPTD